jgi:hypothetical protein
VSEWNETSVTAHSHYTVQKCTHHNGEIQTTECIHVDALSATDAAERALAETLIVHGQPDQVRAKVWKLDENYQPVSVLLYRPA